MGRLNHQDGDADGLRTPLVLAHPEEAYASFPPADWLVQGDDAVEQGLGRTFTSDPFHRIEFASVDLSTRSAEARRTDPAQAGRQAPVDHAMGGSEGTRGDDAMNGLPRLMPTSATGETYAGVTYHLDGELVPVLTVDVSNRGIFFEHHILLWKHPTVRVGIMPVKGAIRRMMAGMQIFVTRATGQGCIAFSRDGAGHVVPVHLSKGEGLHVREHQFLAATDGVRYTYERVRGLSNLLFGQSGYFIDHFVADAEDGILWLHGYGNVFEKTLAAGESIDIEPGGWVFKDPSVRMDTVSDRLTSGIFAAGFNLVLNRFTGPGRVGLQSMYLHAPSDT